MRRIVALALLAAAGCARNLDLPEDRGTPTITAITPAAAYAGQLVTATGTGFDADPARNQLHFASGASAAGASVGPGTLTARVPHGAGTGPVAASNAAGTGAPFGSFQYRGGGQLQRGAARSPRTPSHVPVGIAATASDVFIESSLWGGIVSLLDFRFDGDGGEQVVSVGGGAAVAWLHRSTAAGVPSQVIRQVVPDAVPGSPVRVAATYGGQRYSRMSRVAAFGARPELLAVLSYDNPAGGPLRMLLTTYDATSLAVLDATRTLTIDDFWAIQDGGRGRLAIFGVRSGVDGLYLVNPGFADAWLPAPQACPGASFAYLAGTATQPLAVATLASGHAVAAFLDCHSDIATVDLDAGALAFDPTPIDTHALVEFASGLATAGPWLAVSKRTESLVLGIDLAARAIRWNVSTPSPGPATGDAAGFRVASLVNNDALEIDAGTGVVRARRDFGLFPGVPAIRGGLGFCAAARCGVDELHMVTDYPAGTLVTTPSGALVFANLSHAGFGVTDSTQFGVTVAQGVQWSWGSKWVYDDSSGVTQATAGTILGMAGDADRAWVAHQAGLTRLQAGVEIGTIPLDADQVLGPLVLPGGGTALAWHDPGTGQWLAALLDSPQAASGVLPTPYTLPRPASALFLVDGTPWVAWAGTVSGAYQSAAEALFAPAGGTTHPAGRVVLDYTLSDVVAQSPNGLVLVQIPQGGGDIFLIGADPAASFPLLATVTVEGRVTGFTFDESGENAYAITRVPEHVVALE